MCIHTRACTCSVMNKCILLIRGHRYRSISKPSERAFPYEQQHFLILEHRCRPSKLNIVMPIKRIHLLILHSCGCATGPYIKGEYVSSSAGIAKVKMGWTLADGKPAVAYTAESNVVPISTSNFEPGEPVGLINSITKRECPREWRESERAMNAICTSVSRLHESFCVVDSPISMHAQVLTSRASM